MPSLYRRVTSRTVLAFALCMGVFALALPVSGAETSNSEFVIIQEDDVFPDDLYAGAIRVIVEGTIEGDLIAFAGEEVVIEGTVTGSVFALSPSVTVAGEVGGSVRVLGNSLEVSGIIGEDLVGAVVVADLSSTSQVDGDVLLWAWRVSALGSIGGDLEGSQRNLALAGSVGGDVDISAGTVEVVGDLDVGGDLGYRSRNDASGLDNAVVGGAIVGKTPLPPNLRVRALGLLGRFMIVLFLSVAALTAAYGWPRRTADAVAGVGRRPVRKWLLGALILFAPILAIALAAVILGLAPAAAALPMFAVLVPVILALLGISLALTLIAGAPVVGWLGGVIFRRLDLYGSILVGSLLVGLTWYVPWLGWLVPLVVLPLGLGAWLGNWRQSGEVSEMSVST